MLDFYLDADPTAVNRLDFGSLVTFPGSRTIVRDLLERGLDPNQTDWLGKTFLQMCAEIGNRAVAAALLDAGADINAREVEFQGTPLAAAVRSCSNRKDYNQAKRGKRMIEFLLKRGAATDLPGDEPWATPLGWARKRGLADVVQLLREHRAS